MIERRSDGVGDYAAEKANKVSEKTVTSVLEAGVRAPLIQRVLSLFDIGTFHYLTGPRPRVQAWRDAISTAWARW